MAKQLIGQLVITRDDKFNSLIGQLVITRDGKFSSLVGQLVMAQIHAMANSAV